MAAEMPSLTDPSQVSLTHSYPAMVDSTPPRSRNASNNKLMDNTSSIHIGLGNTPSRVSLGTVLACQPTNINDSHATITEACGSKKSILGNKIEFWAKDPKTSNFPQNFTYFGLFCRFEYWAYGANWALNYASGLI